MKKFVTRRNFLKSAAVAAAASAIPRLAALGQGRQNRKPRIAILFDDSFPRPLEIDIMKSSMTQALPNDSFDSAFLGPDGIRSKLNPKAFDLFLNPYGSMFPKEAFVAIDRYLAAGGNWVNLGGVPFSVPLVRSGRTWKAEVRQVNYHKKLGITQSFPVPGERVKSFSSTPAIAEGDSLTAGLSCLEVYELYVRFTSTRDYPEEEGSPGQREAVLTPVVWGFSQDGTKVSAPIVMIDRLLGDYAGGRWLLANFRGSLEPSSLRRLVELALQSSVDFTVTPSFACYREGEVPSFRARVRRPKKSNSPWSAVIALEIRDGRGERVSMLSLPLKGNGELMTGEVSMHPKDAQHLTPGFYRVTGRIQAKPFVPAGYESGFWVYDRKLLAGGGPFRTDSDWLLRDGKPYPVTGTTYMSSDVHRKFLFEPNPALWNDDFAAMKASGVNMVRTGIWAAWRDYMPEVGKMNEPALRSLDAFLLTARKFDIPVIFTFFAFLPEPWGGENPYLDPRSVRAQKEFIGIIARRYGIMNDIIWDLINEPSFCSPKQLWSTRPNYDHHESNAWREWLESRYPEGSETERTTKLQELWRMTAEEGVGLPKLEEFSDANIFYGRRPMKVLDYRLFAQDAFNGWVEEMKKAIRSNGNPLQLVTVGQDEGGTYERPGPQFYARTVDFTCLHNWWANDDILWDSIVTKSPLKPNLVEETGVMFYEKIDGVAWRTEEDAGNLLEKKLVYSLGANGAGFIQWIWNTNMFMQSDNEAAIGLFRADGTAKPEFEAFRVYARFFARHAHLLAEKKEADVVMVIPHAQMFSVRNYATEATKKCVRIMHEECEAPMRAVSEFTVEDLRDIPKLLVVPSAQCLSDKAWEGILRKVEAGATLLISGVTDRNEYWLPVSRLQRFGIQSEIRPVGNEEFMVIDGKEYWQEFRGEKIERLEKAVLQSKKAELTVLRHGRGTILWSPVPMELGEPVEPLVALYNHALRRAGVGRLYSAKQNSGSVLIRPTIFREVILYTFVSEADLDATVALQDAETKARISTNVRSQRTAMVLLSRRTGEIVGRVE